MRGAGELEPIGGRPQPYNVLPWWRLMFRRLSLIGLVDWEFTRKQCYCCIARPRKIYEFVLYRKQTRHSFVRSDPGMLIVDSALTILTGWVLGFFLISISSSRGLLAAGHSGVLGKLTVWFWGFGVWPLVLELGTAMGASFLTFMSLRKYGEAKSRGKIMPLKAPRKIEDLAHGILKLGPNLGPGRTTADLEVLYCMDIFLNGYLVFLLMSMVLPLPLLIGSFFGYGSSSYTVSFLLNFCLAAGVGWFTFHLALGLAIMPPPYASLSVFIFAPLLAVWITLLVLTVFKIPVTVVLLRFLFGWFLLG